MLASFEFTIVVVIWMRYNVLHLCSDKSTVVSNLPVTPFLLHDRYNMEQVVLDK